MDKVYLAGPITGQTLEGAKDWRKTAKDYLASRNILGLTPLRGKDYLNAIVEADGTYESSFSDVHPLSTRHSIWARDKWDAQRCNLLFAYFPKGKRVSIGTCMEIALACEAGVYVLTVMEDGENNPHCHGMILEASSIVLEDFEEGLQLIPVILG